MGGISTYPAFPRRGFLDSNGNIGQQAISYFNNLAKGNITVQYVTADGSTIFAPSAGQDGQFLLYLATVTTAPQSITFDPNGAPGTGSAAFVNAPDIPLLAGTYAALFAGSSATGQWYGILPAASTANQVIDQVLSQTTTEIAAPNPANGTILDVILRQDSTGGRLITWGPGFSGASANLGQMLASTLSTFHFVYSALAGEWVMVGQPTVDMQP